MFSPRYRGPAVSDPASSALDRLLNSLLGVKADEHVRYFIDREHRPGPGSVRLSATKKLLGEILLAGHQAATSLPSSSAA
jgi:hypothetical protein